MHRSASWLFAVALIAIAIAAATVSTLAQTPPGEAPSSILISRQLAESRGLAVGGIVRLSADAAGTNARSFRVAGIYEPTPDPMRFAQRRLEARLHLPDMLTLTAEP